MIGQTITGRRPGSEGAIVWSILTFLNLSAALWLKMPWAILDAVFPGSLALALWLARPARFQARLTEAGIEVADPFRVIPYAEIVEIWPDGRVGDPTIGMGQRFMLVVQHSQGVLVIPPTINVSALDLYRFLRDRLPPSGSREINPLLASWLQAQEDTFGAERVWSYRARCRLYRRSPDRTIFAASAALFLSALLWLVVGPIVTENPLFLYAHPAALAGWSILILVVNAVQRRAAVLGIPRWRQSSLVISPLGLALVQGHLKGMARWDELLDARIENSATYSWTGYHPVGLRLYFKGAMATIADIYDRPLSQIAAQIQRYRDPVDTTTGQTATLGDETPRTDSPITKSSPSIPCAPSEDPAAS